MANRVFRQQYTSSLAPGQTLARNSVATFVNSAGEIELAAINTPRFEADGLLLEPAATNSVANPTNLTATGWASSGITATGAGAFGLFTAVELAGQGGAQSELHAQYQMMSGTWVSGATYSITVVLRTTGTSPQFSIRLFDVVNGAGSTYVATFADPTTQTSASSSTAGTMTNPVVKNLSNQTMVISVLWQPAANTSSLAFGIGCGEHTSGQTVIGLGTNLTNLPVHTSFMTGTSRSLDFLSDVTLPSALSAGTLVAGIRIPYGSVSADVVRLVLSTAANQRLVVRSQIGTARGVVVSGGPVVASLGVGSDLNNRVVSAIAFADNDFRASFNGSAVVSDTSGSAPSVDSLDIVTLDAPLYVDFAAVYDAPLTDAELQAESARVFDHGFVANDIDVAIGFSIPLMVQGQSLESVGLSLAYGLDVAGIAQAQAAEAGDLGFPLSLGVPISAQPQATAASGLAYGLTFNAPLAHNVTLAPAGRTITLEQKYGLFIEQR